MRLLAWCLLLLVVFCLHQNANRRCVAMISLCPDETTRRNEEEPQEDGSFRFELVSSSFLQYDPKDWLALPHRFSTMPGWHESSDEEEEDVDSVDPRSNYRSFERRRESDLVNQPTHLASVIVNYCPLVAGPRSHSKLFGRKAFKEWMTVTDLAFTVMVLETYVNKWNRIALNDATSGKKIDGSKKVGGVRRFGGIEGTEARERYDSLVLYFQSKLYNAKSAEARANVDSLQAEVDRLVKEKENQLTPDLPVGPNGEPATLTQVLQQEGLSQSMQRHQDMMESAEESQQDIKWAVGRVIIAVARLHNRV